MHTEIVTAAIPILINHKVLLEDVDKWLAKRRQIYRRKSLSYVLTLFYAMRCIFWQERPQPTLNFESMKVDRLPKKSSDFNISVPSKYATKDERDKCTKKRNPLERHLLDVTTKASKYTSHMKVDFNLFSIAQSFFMNTLLTQSTARLRQRGCMCYCRI